MSDQDSVHLKFSVATSTEMEVAIKRYLVNLKASGKSTSTQEKYQYHLERWRLWLLARDISEPSRLTRSILDEWVAELHEHWSPATVKQGVAALRSFVRWLHDAEWIKKKHRKRLFKALKLPKVAKNVQRTLTIDEIEALMADCDLNTKKGRRDAALIGILVDSGLRASEVRRLRVGDLEFGVKLMPGVEVNRLTVTVKGNKRRSGYFGKRTARHVKAWLEIREEIARVDVEELFISIGGKTSGTKLSEDGLKVILRKLGEKAGIKGVSPHPFRRAFAVILEMAGASTRTTQELGRWEGLEMVLLYTRDYKAAMQYNRFAPMDFMAQAQDENKHGNS